MTNSWRIPINFEMWVQQIEKRIMRVERRPAVTHASQILGPGAGPFAILLNDWNEESATFNGIYYSAPDARNTPDDPAGASTMHWLGETFGAEDVDGYRWGIQRLTRFHVETDAAGDPPVSWEEYHRRFFPDGELVAYTAWELA